MPTWDTDWLRLVAKRGYTTIYDDKDAATLLVEAADEIDRLQHRLDGETRAKEDYKDQLFRLTFPEAFPETETIS